MRAWQHCAHRPAVGRLVFDTTVDRRPGGLRHLKGDPE